MNHLAERSQKKLFTHSAGHGQSPDSEPDETACFHVWESHTGISSMGSGPSFEPFGEGPFVQPFTDSHVFHHGHGFVT